MNDRFGEKRTFDCPVDEAFQDFSGRLRSRQYGFYLWEYLWDKRISIEKTIV